MNKKLTTMLGIGISLVAVLASANSNTNNAVDQGLQRGRDVQNLAISIVQSSIKEANVSSNGQSNIVDVMKGIANRVSIVCNTTNSPAFWQLNK